MIFTFMLVLAAAGAIHRIWIYEEIARPIKNRIVARIKHPFLSKMLTCPPCFAFWSCVIACGIWWYVAPAIILLALYAGLRLIMGGMSLINQASAKYLTIQMVATPDQRSEAMRHMASRPAAVRETPAEGAVCIPCNKGKRKVVIFTVFNSLERSYSLVGVALDQARALALAGYQVEFWTTNNSNTTAWPKDMPIGINHVQIVPAIAWKDDVIERSSVDALKSFLMLQIDRLKGATIITHDLQFLTSYVSFGQALREIGPTPEIRWLHMAHSRAASTRPTHTEGILRSTLMDGHHLLYPSPSDTMAMANYFNIAEERVHIAPNIRDISLQNRWTTLARKIAAQEDLFNADIVQVYPFSTPRAKAKGVDTVIKIFGKLQEAGNTVRLLLVNAHNHGEVPRVEIERLTQLARQWGLSAKSVVFTNSYPEAFDGVSGDVIADLQQVANLFVFPSTSESCGMVMLEAGINGQLLVLNEALPTMFDAADHRSAFFVNFGQNVDATSPVLIEEVADRIDAHLRGSMENLSKRGLLRQYSLDAGGAALVEAVEGVWKVDGAA